MKRVLTSLFIWAMFLVFTFKQIIFFYSLLISALFYSILVTLFPAFFYRNKYSMNLSYIELSHINKNSTILEKLSFFIFTFLNAPKKIIVLLFGILVSILLFYI
jgi:hypothetical protein